METLLSTLVALGVVGIALRVFGRDPGSLLGKVARYLRIVSHDAADTALSSTRGGVLRDAIREDRSAVVQSTISAGDVAAAAERFRRELESKQIDLRDLRGLLAQQVKDGREALALQTAESIASLEGEVAEVEADIAAIEASYTEGVEAVAEAEARIRGHERRADQLDARETVFQTREVTEAIVHGGSRTDEALRQREKDVATLSGRDRARRDVRGLSPEGQLAEYRRGQVSDRAKAILHAERTKAAATPSDAPTTSAS
ncbi:MAG: PspA/IM30 family protein [Deltaproteobacteria bacterium]|nr:PspA/IM30 family protein [Deltaproteobacteria bacterium]